jgi:Rrf2 family transcriptional regulator, cysteine metabolism repressor
MICAEYHEQSKARRRRGTLGTSRRRNAALLMNGPRSPGSTQVNGGYKRGLNNFLALFFRHDLTKTHPGNNISFVKISTRSRYGLRAMLELALHQGEGPVMMQTIAQNQGVSRKYLDTIFSSLKNGGLIHSRRGIGGGHVLTKDPDQIRVGDILRAIEGPLSLVDCVGSPYFCARSHRCVTRDVWSEISQAIDTVLDSITLADLVKKHGAMTKETGGPEGSCLLD